MLSELPIVSTSRHTTTCRSRWSGMASFANLKYDITPDIHFSVKGIWNRRKSSEPGCSAAVRYRSGAGITPVLDTTTVDVTNPFNPFGVTLDSSNMNSHFCAASSKVDRADSSRPSTRPTALRRSTAISRRSTRIGTGTSTASTATTKPSRRCSATSTPANLRHALGPVAAVHAHHASRSTSSAV